MIGAYNSSNSLRLVEVAKEYGSRKSILLEKINEFDDNLLKDIKSVGITASASAPEVLVQNFIKILKSKYKLKIFESKYNKENIVKRLLGTGLPRKSIGFLNGLNIWHYTIFVLAFYQFVKFV